MPVLTMTKGLPASGKSTWAKEQVLNSGGKTKRVNKDDLRSMVDAGKWSKGNENEIIRVRDTLVRAWLSQGYNVIVDDTNFDPKHEETLRFIANWCKADFKIQDFTEVSLESCLKRDAARLNGVGAHVIKTMYNRYLRPQSKRRTIYPDKPWCVVSDLDGTLADISHRSPYDASTCIKDGLRREVLDAVRGLQYVKEAALVLVSGREDIYREQTVAWLDLHGIPDDLLFMRPRGDMRNDAIVKQEILKNLIEPNFNVYAVFDDRPKVIRMWEDEGLVVFNVGKEGVEF